VIHGIIPVILFTMNAVRNIRAVYLRSARAMRLTLRIPPERSSSRRIA
jgi:NitT/TauT family transport system permease protein